MTVDDIDRTRVNLGMPYFHISIFSPTRVMAAKFPYFHFFPPTQVMVAKFPYFHFLRHTEQVDNWSLGLGPPFTLVNFMPATFRPKIVDPFRPVVMERYRDVNLVGT